MYQSDITQFLNQLKKHNPALEQAQRLAYARLWNNAPSTLDERVRNEAARVKLMPR